MVEESTYRVTHEVVRVVEQEVEAISREQAISRAERGIDSNGFPVEFVSAHKKNQFK